MESSYYYNHNTMFLSNQEQLVQYLISSGVFRTPEIVAAFRQVDRIDFVPEEYRREAYADYPLPIGFGQTISQPMTVAFMIELLYPRSGNIILDIGSGSGWTTAILAFLAGNSGYVTGVEIIPELVVFGRGNLAKYPFVNASILPARQKGIGIPGNTFDRILVSAGARTFPEELLDQLNPGGRLVIPVGNSVFLYEKDDKRVIHRKEFPGFVFVPLRV